MGRLGSFFSKFTRSKASEADLDECRTLLLEADFGNEYTTSIIECVKRLRPEELMEGISSEIINTLSSQSREVQYNDSGVTTILVVGVNGTGKTTSAAKLANRFARDGKRVLLTAADTFRAAAIEQLITWGERIGVPVMSGPSNSDPAALAFDAATRARNENFDILIIDTAGRLHTKNNLMDELSKVKRVIEKVTPVNEVLFVLDGTTGQNGISQAKVFGESAGVTGIIVTKIDGSARGGIALATERAVGVPIKFIGSGEAIEDFAPFEPRSYLAELLTNP